MSSTKAFVYHKRFDHEKLNLKTEIEQTEITQSFDFDKANKTNEKLELVEYKFNADQISKIKKGLLGSFEIKQKKKIIKFKE